MDGQHCWFAEFNSIRKQVKVKHKLISVSILFLHNLLFMFFRYLKNVRETTNQEKGGGFESRMACQRALMDAMCGLFFFPGVQPTSKDPQQGSSAMT